MEMEGEIGVIQNTTDYWGDGKYENNGNFFSAYKTTGDGNSLEDNQGTLQSAPFILGASGVVTFRIGGMGDYEKYILKF